MGRLFSLQCRSHLAVFSMDSSIMCHSRGIHQDLSSKQQSIVTYNRKYKALLLDAGGTLLQTARPVEETYASYGLKYGVNVTLKDIKEGFKKAFSEPWPERLRYEGDGKLFWRYAVAQATGSDNEQLFEELYGHYAKAAAWKLPEGALRSLITLREFGVKLGVISNFDSRLRPILEELNISNLFHAVIVSSEVGYEKPSPEIFKAALSELNVQPNETVLVGDDPIADKQGAMAVGIDAWLWRKEVTTFNNIANRILGLELAPEEVKKEN